MPHFSASDLRRAASLSGGLPTGSTPLARNRAFTSCRENKPATSRLRRAIIAAGVRAGAKTDLGWLQARHRRTIVAGRKEGRRSRAAHRDPPQLAGVEVRRHRRGAAERKLHLACQHADDGRTGTLVRDVRDPGGGHQLEQLGGEMRRGADPAGRIVERARLRFRQLDQLADGMHGQRRMDDQDVRRIRHDGNGRKIPDRIEGRLAEQRPQPQRRPDDEQGMAVGLRAGDDFAEDGGAARRARIDHDGLSQRTGYALRDDTGSELGGAARRARDDTQRTRRIVFRDRGNCAGQPRSQRYCCGNCGWLQS